MQVWDWGANVQIDQPSIPAYVAVSRDGSVLLTRNDETGHIHVWDGNALFQTRSVAVEAMGKRPIALGAIKRTTLYQNFPNPFNPETWIPYRLEKESAVAIRIYDDSGALIRTLPLGVKQTGIYRSKSSAAYWNGRNAVGEPVASGIYFYTLDAVGFSATKKMIIRK